MSIIYEQYPATNQHDNIKMWTGLSVEKSVRITEDRDKWRKYVHSVANPRIEDGQRSDQILGSGLVVQVVFALLRGNWQDFY